MKKRIISIILSIVMLVGLLPTTAWATDPHSHCVCGGGISVGGHTHDSTAPTWTAWDGADMDEGVAGVQLTAGSYYLTGDVGVNSSVIIVGEVNLCLNGHTITTTNGYGAFHVKSGATLNICDCSTNQSGKIKNTNATTYYPGIRNNGGTVNVYGGTVSGAYTGIININNSGGTVNVYGGTVSGSTGIYNEQNNNLNIYNGTAQTTGSSGYGIYNQGTVSVSGGTVTGSSNGIRNYYTGTINVSGTVQVSGSTGIYNEGGTVSVSGGIVQATGSSKQGIYNSGSLTVSGGTVTANNGSSKGIDNSGTLNLQGAPSITGAAADIYLKSDQLITIVGELTYTEGNVVSVKMNTPGTFTTGWNSNMSGKTPGSYFTSKNEGYTVQLDSNNELKLAEPPAAETHSHPICGATCTHDGTHSTAENWTELTASDLSNGTLSLAGGKSYYLGENITVTKTVAISGTVNLCLNGYSIENSTGSTIQTIIQVHSGATLNICNCTTGGTASKIENTNNSTGLGTTTYGIYNSGTVNVYGGTISATTAATTTTTGSGSGIYNQGGQVTVVGTGAVVSGTRYGIYNNIANGTVSVSDGTVSGMYGIYNKGKVIVDGGITVTGTGYGISNSGTVSVSGGTVQATNNSGQGIYSTGGTVSVSGGTVSGKYGVNLYGSGGTVSGGTVSGLTFGVYASSTGNITISGGEVSASNSDSYGVYHSGSGAVEISGGTVSGKHGVYLYGSGNVTVSGGTVGGTGSTRYGIYLHSKSTGVVSVNGGTISGTTYGIYTENGSAGSVAVSGDADISGAQDGILHYGKGTVTVSGGTVKSPQRVTGTTSSGIKILAGGGDTIVSGGTVSGVDYGIYNDGKLTLSNAPTITGDTADVYLDSGKLITITGELTYIGGDISVQMAATDGGTFTTGWNSNMSGKTPGSYFTSKNEGYTVQLDSNNELKLAEPPAAETHSHPICGATHTNIGDHTGTCEAVEWTALSTVLTQNGDGTYNGTLSSGNYYLDKDMTVKGTSNYNNDFCIDISGTAETPAHVNLCLNGHQLTGSSGDVTLYVSGNNVSDNASLNICDCYNAATHTGAEYTHTYTSPISGENKTVNGGLITGAVGGYAKTMYANDAQVNFYGGTFAGNGAGENGGGALYMSGVFLRFYDGSITDNYLSSGGVLAMESSEAHLIGGSVTGNAAYDGVTDEDDDDNVGGVRLFGNSTATIHSGFDISGNKAGLGAGESIDSNLLLGFRYNSSPWEIKLTGAMDTPIGIRMYEPGVFTSGFGTVSGASLNDFVCEQRGYFLATEDDGTAAEAKLEPYAITTQPTTNAPQVATNKSDDVASYSWHSQASEVVDEDSATALTYYDSICTDGVWSGEPQGSGYEIYFFTMELNAGDTLTATLVNDDYFYRIVLDSVSSGSTSIRNINATNGTEYVFEIPADDTYALGVADTNGDTPTFPVVRSSVGSALDGQITATLTDGTDRDTYVCKVTFKDGTVLVSDPVEYEAPSIPVTGVELSESSLTLDVGGTATLTATVLPDDATDKSVSWESSDPTVAKVENGVVTALKPGSTTITATATDGSFTDTCTVTVNKIAITGTIAITTTQEPTVGQEFSLDYIVIPNGNYSRTGRAFSPSGSIEAGKDYTLSVGLKPNDGYYFADGVAATINGKAATVVRSGDNISIQYTYSFASPAANSVDILQDEIPVTTVPIVLPGIEQADVVLPFTAKVLDQYGHEMTGQTIEWSITGTNTTGISVNNGTLTVTKNAAVGNYTLTATCGGKSDSITIQVEKAESVATSIKIFKGENEVTADTIYIPEQYRNTVNYTAIVYNQYGEVMSADDAEITKTHKNTTATGFGSTEVNNRSWNVYVDASTGKAGSFDLVLTSGDASASVHITFAYLETQTITCANVTGTYGQTEELKLNPSGKQTAGAYRFAIKSGASTDVVEVAADGKLTIKNAGETTIVVTAPSDATHASASVWVKVTVDKAKAEITVDQTAIVKTYGEAIVLPEATSTFGEVVCDKTAEDLVNVGSYTVTYTVAGTSNYDGDTKTVSVTINKLAVNEPSVTGTYTYTGGEQTATVTGKEAYMTATGDVKGTNADNYTITYTLDKNHCWANGSDGKVTWSIAKADYDMSGVTFSDATTTYDGSEHKPAVSGTLPTGKDNIQVTVSYSDGQTTVGEKTVTATFATTSTNYNVPEAKTAKQTITAAEITNISVSQTGTLTYTGQPQTATVSTSATTVNSQTVSFTYCDTQNGTYTASVPAFTAAGNHTVYYKVTAPNHGEKSGSFTVSIGKAPVTAPTISSKAYTGGTLTADVATSTLYTVTTNAGGTAVGSYDVVLTLSGTTNYKWSDSEDAAKTLKFNITKADNAWTTTPAIADVTYGTAISPVGEAKFGTAAITYVGTGSTSYASSTTAPTDAGTYKATFAVAATNDYGNLSTDVTFTIAQKAVTLTTDDKSKVYGENDPELTSTLTGGLVGTDTLNYTLSRAEGETVGTYTISAVLGENPNYAVTVKNDGKLTISKATPTVQTALTALAIYGNTVDDDDIRGAMNVPGRFAWKNVTSYGNATAESTTTKFDAVFTPTDAVNYETLDVDVAVTVLKASQSSPAKGEGFALGEGKLTAKDGYELSDGTDTQSSFTIDASKTYSIRKAGDANHFASPYTAIDTTVTVNVLAVPSSMGTVSGGGKYAIGSNVTLTASPRSGYEFVEWQDLSGAQKSTNAKYTIPSITTGQTLIAAFKPEDKVVATLPTIKDAKDLVYTGSELTGISGGTGWTQVDGDLTGTNAGVYSAKIKLANNFDIWPDGTTGEKTIGWEIFKASQNAPKNVSATENSITGVNDTMEYMKMGGSSYTGVTDTTISDLAAGTYYVRVKETANYYASPATVVIVSKPTLNVVTLQPSDLKSDSVTLNGVFAPYKAECTAKFLLNGAEKLVESVDANGIFALNVTDLTPDADYTVTAVVNDTQGNTVTFHTPAAAAPVVVDDGRIKVNVTAEGSSSKFIISVERGNDVIASRASDNASGDSATANFDNLPYGNYNVVVRTNNGHYTETKMLSVAADNKEVTVNFTIPVGKLATVVDVKTKETPKTAVDGLSEILSADDKKYAAVGSKDVEIKLEVEKKNETQAAGATKIKELLTESASENVKVDFIDMSLIKTTTELDASGNATSIDTQNIGATNNTVIKIAVPYDSSSGAPMVLRYHNGMAQELTKLSDRPTAPYVDGTYFVDSGYVFIYASGFSTYAISYAQSTSHGGHGGNVVISAPTGDMGVALYAGLAISSLLGMGWLGKKKRDEE